MAPPPSYYFSNNMMPPPARPHQQEQHSKSRVSFASPGERMPPPPPPPPQQHQSRLEYGRGYDLLPSGIHQASSSSKSNSQSNNFRYSHSNNTFQRNNNYHGNGNSNGYRNSYIHGHNYRNNHQSNNRWNKNRRSFNNYNYRRSSYEASTEGSNGCNSKNNNNNSERNDSNYGRRNSYNGNERYARSYVGGRNGHSSSERHGNLSSNHASNILKWSPPRRASSASYDDNTSRSSTTSHGSNTGEDRKRPLPVSAGHEHQSDPSSSADPKRVRLEPHEERSNYSSNNHNSSDGNQKNDTVDLTHDDDDESGGNVKKEGATGDVVDLTSDNSDGEEDEALPMAPPAARAPAPDAMAPPASRVSDTNSAIAQVPLAGDADPSEHTETHVIFAIDFSGSMKLRDVESKSQKGEPTKISRWEAVYTCIDSFLEEQLQQQQDNDNNNATCLVSLLIFNEESKVLVERMPLVGNGRDVRSAVKRAKDDNKPRLGTGFSAGFRCAEQCAAYSLGKSKNSNVLLVFLSDGRPGDLSPQPPKDASFPMQTTFRRCGKEFPAAGQYIEQMQRDHENFSLQLVCLYSEGKPWLEYLANRYKGTFHNPDLTLDDEPQHVEDDEVIEMKVKSMETIMRERYNEAKSSGNVVSLTSATTSGSTSIRSTFQSISSTVSALRGTQLQERSVTLMDNSPMINHEATRMVLTTDSTGEEKFINAPGEVSNGRKVKVSFHPFAQGGLRNVYRMKQFGEAQQVAKESRHDIKYQERLKFHLETVKCQARAADYADAFNKRVKKQKQKKGAKTLSQIRFSDIERITMLRAEVYRLKAPRCPGGFRYLAVENEMKGDYEKWNNNDGYVNPSDDLKCHVAQAFSHFSYEHSNKQNMVVDIQGCGYVYTDPQLHSVEKEFGRADRGTKGFEKFFRTHKCGFVCKQLGLKDRSASSFNVGSGGQTPVKLERN